MQEYVDFLGRQAPYDRLDADDLQALARVVEVEFFTAGATIVRADGPRLDHLYVIRTGTARVVDRGQVVDELGPGDTFGHISVLSGLPPALSVVAVTETLCYRLPDPRTLLRTPERLTFAHYNSMVSRHRLVSVGSETSGRPVAELMRGPTWCEPETAVREAARLITEANQSCILFRTPAGVGIMTDSDCRRAIATGEIPVDAPVSAVGTVPVRSVASTTTASEAFLEMVLHGVHHVVVVDDRGAPVGVARVVDLSSVDIRHPVVIRRAIDNARDLGDLAEASVLLRPTAVELADAGVPGLRVGALLGAMIEAIVERCVRLDASRADAPEEPPSWLILGSLARREPLPSSDVDTALIWSSSGAPTPPTPEAMQEYAERVIASFETCGLRRCPDGANATDRLFNRSEEAWLAAVNRWTTNPDDPGALLLSAMVCDSRPVTGVHLARELMAVMQHESTRRPYLGRMLAEALAHKPPTGFVRDFVVEASGDHRGELDLKRRGLGPVVAIGRWLSLVAPAASTSTQDRLRAGAAAGLLTRDETDTLRGAHQDMFELLFQREVEAIRSGGAVSTYLRPRTLDTLTRRHLRESFRAIRTVQTRLEAEWALRVRS